MLHCYRRRSRRTGFSVWTGPPAFVPQALIAEDRTDRPLCGYAQVCACGWRIVISPATGDVTLLPPVAGLARVAPGGGADFKGIREG
jgi:hypothetical protein